MAYLGEVVSSALSIIFFIAVIAALGYLVGGISIKGISLGTAGVLLVALLFGVLASYVPSFEIGGKKKGHKQIENITGGIIVKDDIEYGHGIEIPLWHFGLNY